MIQQIGLFPHKTIGDNIATVPHLLGWDKRRTSERVEELLGSIGLPGDFRDRYPSQLSGGQRQRVGVARALAADPPLMLMDEPFGAIDPINRERLQNEFLRLQAELRKTIVFVTHDIDEAIKMGDRIAILKEGGILAQYATPAELLMYPAEPFVEDFVGSDRALKRLALQRVRDIDLWKAPLVRDRRAGRRGRGQARPTPTSRSRSSSTTRAARWAGCRSADCRASGARGLPLARRAGRRARRHPARRLVGPALRRLPVRPGRRRRGRVAGVLSMEVALARAQRPGRARPERHRARRHAEHGPRRRPTDAGLAYRSSPSWARLLRQPRGRRPALPGQQRPLPGLDPRQLRPTTGTRSWEHVLLSIVPLAIGFVIATSLALFAHRYRAARRRSSSRSSGRCSRSPRSPST